MLNLNKDEEKEKKKKMKNSAHCSQYMMGRTLAIYHAL